MAIQNDRIPFVSGFNGKKKNVIANEFKSFPLLDFEACVELTGMNAAPSTFWEPGNLHCLRNAVDKLPELNFDVTRRRFVPFSGPEDLAA